MFCASVFYPVQEGAKFDFDYLATKHVPKFAELLGANCVRFEAQRHLDSPGAPPPVYIASAYWWVESDDQFGAALAVGGAEIYRDIGNFSDVEPVRQWCEVA